MVLLRGQIDPKISSPICRRSILFLKVTSADMCSHFKNVKGGLPSLQIAHDKMAGFGEKNLHGADNFFAPLLQ